MAMPAVLRIDIIADAKKAQTAMGQVGDTAKTTGSRLSGMAGAIGGALAVGAVVQFGKAAVTSAEDAASATAGLEQVFSQMGDTTGTAADSAVAYAEAMSKKIGVDDDAIIAAQTQLATFGAVSDETARTAGVFDRATSAAADLAAAGFGSLDSNAVQLGKALNDPVKGLSALSKSGVTFTDAEKEMIASMVEAGEVTKAQEVVLAAIEKQVGGTAEATVTESAKMGVAFGEVSEAVGGVLLPILQALAPILVALATFLQENMNWLLPLAGAILAVAAAVKIWGIAQLFLSSTLAPVLLPIIAIVAAIAAVIAIVVLLVKNWDKVVAVAKRVWAAVSGAVTKAFDAIKATVTRVWRAIVETVTGIWQGIRDRWNQAVTFFTSIKDRILGFFVNALNWLLSAGRNIVTGLWDGLKAAWENVATWLGGFVSRVVGFYANAGRWLYDVGKKIIQGLWDGLKDMWSNVTGWFSGLGDQIADLKGPPARDARLLINAGRLIMGGLQSGLETGWGGVASYLGSRNMAINGALGVAGAGGGAGAAYNMNIYPRTVDVNDVAWGFRRLELQRGRR